MKFLSLPLEIRQEIYQHYLLACRRHPLAGPGGGYPTPHLQEDYGHGHSWILVPSYKAVPYSRDRKNSKPTSKISDLLRVSRSINADAQAVLYERFIFSFSVWHSPSWAYYFFKDMNKLARAQIRHLALVIRIYNGWVTDDAHTPKVDRFEDWIEGNEVLVDLLPSLRSVAFELQIPSYRYNPRVYSPVPDHFSSPIFAPLVKKCLAIARPFNQVPGLQIRWVGQDLGAEVAHLCSGC